MLVPILAQVTGNINIGLAALGAAIGVREHTHITLDLFGARLGPQGHRVLDWVARTATLAFAGLLIGPGWRFVRVGMSNFSPAMEIPMGLVYLAPVVGGILIGVYLFRPGRTGPGAGRGRSEA